MRIALTTEEMIEFGTLGLARCANALEKRRRGAHGFDRNDERWQIDVEGLLAEAVVAKALDLPFKPVVGELDTLYGDVAPGVQVRSTKYSSGRLLIHDTDADDDKFVLVTGIYGVYDLRGWMFGREGKNPERRKTYKRRTAYWNEQSDLRPFDPASLLDHLEGK